MKNASLDTEQTRAGRRSLPGIFYTRNRLVLDREKRAALLSHLAVRVSCEPAGERGQLRRNDAVRPEAVPDP